MSNYYSYQRISTDSTKQDFKRQTHAIQKYAEKHNIEITLDFLDEASGKDFNRANFKKLEKVLHTGDTVIFKDISRFTRNATEGIKKYQEWVDKGINLVFLDNPTISTDYIQQMHATAAAQKDLVTKTTLEFIITLLLTVELDRAEQQRIYISEAIKGGIRASQKKSGRPMNTLDKMTPELENDIKSFLADRSIKAIDIMRKHNISRNTLKKYSEIVKNQ